MPTNIEWTEETLNLWVGGSRVSAGCDHCYAIRLAVRLAHNPNLPAATREAYRRAIVKKPNGRWDWSGEPQWIPNAVDKVFSWKKRRMVFVGSMTDVFHPAVPDEWLLRLFQVIADLPQHTFQILTKRGERMASWFADWWNPQRQVPMPKHRGVDGETSAALFLRRACCTECGRFFLGCLNGRKKWKDKAITPNYRDGVDSDWWGHPSSLCDAFKWSVRGNQHGVAVEMEDTHLAVRADALTGPFPSPLKNLWLGVTVENADHLKRLDYLMQTPAAVRFVSLEPLLGPVDLTFIRTGPDQPMEGCPGAIWHPCGNALRKWTAPDDWRPGIDVPPRWQGLDWVIVGAETGPGARPMDPDWARSVRDQCAAAGVPFFLKRLSDGTRVLDGHTHDAMPETGKA